MDDPSEFDLLQATNRELTEAERAKLKRHVDLLVEAMHELMPQDSNRAPGGPPTPANS